LQYNKAPISRVISTKDKLTSTYASPVTFGANGALGSSAVTLQSGRAVTVFFEVPTAPIAASQINIKLHPNGTCSGLHAAPNVVMADADSYLFIRGNSVVANAATASNGIHVVYSAILENVIPVNRTNVNAGSLVRAGDNLNIITPIVVRVEDTPNVITSVDYNETNITSVQSVTGQVISVKHKGQNTYLVDFTVGIDPDLVNSGITGWAANELLFYRGTAANPIPPIIGLAKDQFRVGVSGVSSGSTAWRGSLNSAINLSYPDDNKAGILNTVDSSETTIVTKNWVASSGLPATSDALNIYSEVDYNAGAMPFKCVSIIDNSSGENNFYNLEVSIIPLY